MNRRNLLKSTVAAMLPMPKLDFIMLAPKTKLQSLIEEFICEFETIPFENKKLDFNFLSFVLTKCNLSPNNRLQALSHNVFTENFTANKNVYRFSHFGKVIKSARFVQFPSFFGDLSNDEIKQLFEKLGIESEDSNIISLFSIDKLIDCESEIKFSIDFMKSQNFLFRFRELQCMDNVEELIQEFLQEHTIDDLFSNVGHLKRSGLIKIIQEHEIVARQIGIHESFITYVKESDNSDCCDHDYFSIFSNYIEDFCYKGVEQANLEFLKSKKKLEIKKELESKKNYKIRHYDAEGKRLGALSVGQSFWRMNSE